jgi:hypothetical protein
MDASYSQPEWLLKHSTLECLLELNRISSKNSF